MSAINRAKALQMTDGQTRCELRARSAGEADTVRDAEGCAGCAVTRDHQKFRHFEAHLMFGTPVLGPGVATGGADARARFEGELRW